MDIEHKILGIVQISFLNSTSSFNFIASLSSSFKLSFVDTSPTDEERSSLAGFSVFDFSGFVLEATVFEPLDSY
jgi:hypothetical protein